MLEIIIDSGIEVAQVPTRDALESAVSSACKTTDLSDENPDLCLRFSGDEAIRALNRRWRHRDEPTDVLSFPMSTGVDGEDSYLGDIILSCPTIRKVAASRGLDPDAHTLHLVIHGVLHLLGFDHAGDEDTKAMQSREQQAMSMLGLHDPYPE